jgi:transcriptional regulator with XRE-family HTH domain/molybdate-binding protein
VTRDRPLLGARIRRLRAEHGFSQVELADRAGVSRQLIGAVEAGHHLPRVDAAARLAAALSTTVEQLLAPDPRRAIGVLVDPADGALVRSARVGDRLVCVPSDASGEGWAGADGQLHGDTLHLFERERPAIVVAGCEPAIALSARLAETAGARVLPVMTSSARAVEVLAAGRCHAITVHGREGQLPTPPVPVVRWHVARWQVGVAAPEELGPDWVDDALSGRIPVAQREPGAGSQAAFERAVAARSGTVPVGGPRVSSHTEAAARAGADGIAGVTIEPTARAAGLAFHPLEVHVSEVWVAPEHVGDATMTAFLAELTGARVHRRLAALGGYDLSENGRRIAA